MKRALILLVVTLALAPLRSRAEVRAEPQSPQTRALVTLVDDAAQLIATRGEVAFDSFRVPESRWRQGERYVFVLDRDGNMLVHADAAMEAKNQLGLVDVHGKPIVRGLIAAATAPGKAAGWYHYQWPVPGGLLPRWKSTYVRLATAPDGKAFIVGSGMYSDRMERAFAVDLVQDAVARIETEGIAAFPLLRDSKGPFLAKDAYVFVLDPQGVELVNPGFANLEGKSMLRWRDARGLLVVQKMLEVVQRQGSGWVSYMWPKPGENVATLKSTYVSRAKLGDSWVVVACGIYLADAPMQALSGKRVTAPQVMNLVREGAALLHNRGEMAFPAFRVKGSRWFRGDTYFFVWALDGTRLFHAPDPSLEHQNGRDAKDVLGRPYGQMFLDAASGPSGEGWVHYMYPRPEQLFPTWKSVFVKRVELPSGEQVLIGCGIYEMKMEPAFITDLVDRASALVAARGKDAFPLLRDKTGPFVFMDTYVFVDGLDGVELVNPAQPSIEGKNLLDLRDVNGKLVAREYLDAAQRQGSAWVHYVWYRPGSDAPTLKRTLVREVQHGSERYVVGAGLYAY